MMSQEILNQFSEIINADKEFKAIASYLLVAKNPNADELNKYVQKVTDDSDFELGYLLGSFARDLKSYDTLQGFFKYLGIDDMENFTFNKLGRQVFEYIKNNSVSSRIYMKGSEQYCQIMKFTHGQDKLYFYPSSPNSSHYVCFELDGTKFLNRFQLQNEYLNKVVKIEKKIDGEWITVAITDKEKLCSLVEFKDDSN